MSVSIIIAGIGASMCLHIYNSSIHSANAISSLANLTEYYSGSLYNACRCD